MSANPTLDTVCGTPRFEAQVRLALPFWPKNQRYALKYAEFQPDGHQTARQ
jgi:hypothetical protein